RSPEQDLAVLEIPGEHVRCGRLDRAGAAAVEKNVVDGALFVLKAIYGFNFRLGQKRPSDDRGGELAPGDLAALVGDIASLGETDLADQRLERVGIESAGDPAKARVGGDAARDLGVGDAQPQLVRPRIENVFGEQLADDLAVKPDLTRLLECDLAPE